MFSVSDNTIERFQCFVSPKFKASSHVAVHSCLCRTWLETKRQIVSWFGTYQKIHFQLLLWATAHYFQFKVLPLNFPRILLREYLTYKRLTAMRETCPRCSPSRSEINQAVKSQRIARRLKFRSMECNLRCSSAAQLCTFVFTCVTSRFSDDVAQIMKVVRIVNISESMTEEVTSSQPL